MGGVGATKAASSAIRAACLLIPIATTTGSTLRYLAMPNVKCIFARQPKEADWAPFLNPNLTESLLRVLRKQIVLSKNDGVLLSVDYKEVCLILALAEKTCYQGMDSLEIESLTLVLIADALLSDGSPFP